ncbi:MAG: D-serine dehydratase [Planctomycetota bacterium]|jgi:D-serine dehydratase
MHGKSLAQWQQHYPLLTRIINAEPALWINADYARYGQASPTLSVGRDQIADAKDRLSRFAAYLSIAFPETAPARGIIESPLREVAQLKSKLESTLGLPCAGRLMLKCDNYLPISGSIKARGGIYEVLKHAETLALEHGLLKLQDDYACFQSETFRQLFSSHSIAVGSTGNLGLSIGIISAQLGFKVSVHMSADARQWKKELLRAKGVNVIEYNSDYSEAVKQGRVEAAADPGMHFVDDESSRDLFLGYAVAASRLKGQLDELKIEVSATRPLFVYLPCGVGGGPGGVAAGLKQIFGDHVHCFFAEPVDSPCMLLGMMTGLHEQLSVRDFGLGNVTEADGLAVASPSGFVGREMQQILSGIFTIQDQMLFRLLAMTRDSEGIALEPSALAGLTGPAMLTQSQAGRQYLRAQGLDERMDAATHIVWATGGGMVPDDEMNAYYEKGLFRCG